MKLIPHKSRFIVNKGLRDVFPFILMLLFSINSIGQENKVVTDSPAGQSEGPSLENISKNLTISAEELDRIRRQEILEYVYMILGFAAVFAFAWFLANKAKKRQEKADAAKILRVQQQLKNRANPRR